VPRIGITGHTRLTVATVPLVTALVRARLAGHPPAELVGVTCLARGADQVFARIVLELGGRVEVVLPAEDYREHAVGPDNLAEFDELLGRAERVVTMPFAESGRPAYLAASARMLAAVESVIAVWDGVPATAMGSTADVVGQARRRGLPVAVIWPAGAERG
jgi:hypothetical protein